MPSNVANCQAGIHCYTKRQKGKSNPKNGQEFKGDARKLMQQSRCGKAICPNSACLLAHEQHCSKCQQLQRQEVSCSSKDKKPLTIVIITHPILCMQRRYKSSWMRCTASIASSTSRCSHVTGTFSFNRLLMSCWMLMMKSRSRSSSGIRWGCFASAVRLHALFSHPDQPLGRLPPVESYYGYSLHCREGYGFASKSSRSMKIVLALCTGNLMICTCAWEQLSRCSIRPSWSWRVSGSPWPV